MRRVLHSTGLAEQFYRDRHPLALPAGQCPDELVDLLADIKLLAYLDNALIPARLADRAAQLE